MHRGCLCRQRLSLVELLQHFLEFRLVTVRRRFEYILAQLERRIHILEGFEIIFHGIDRAIQIIRGSDGKEDACTQLLAAFPLDREQTMAILELQLYRISRLEIDTIVAELDSKRAEAASIRQTLGSEEQLWAVVKRELDEVARQFGSPATNGDRQRRRSRRVRSHCLYRA